MADQQSQLDKLLIQVRRIADHRVKGAEDEIRKTSKGLLTELRTYLAETYTKYAEDDRLTYAMLQKHGYKARFLQEVNKKVTGFSNDITRLIRSTVEQTYDTTYNGMVECVNKAGEKRLDKTISSAKSTAIKKAVNNPIHGLTLDKTLEKNRKGVIYDINKSITLGLMNGDRYTTIARNMKEAVGGSYTKAIRITRTETHRVREAGSYAAAMKTDEKLKLADNGWRMQKTWKTLRDERVRPAPGAKGKNKKYDHKAMDGVSVLVDEEFKLPSGATCMYPGSTGVAGEDINCRCFAVYEMKKVESSSETIEELEKQFSDIAEGYSYDDFKNDFGSIEEGFEGADEKELAKAKKIAEKIEALRKKSGYLKKPAQHSTRAKQESIEILKTYGITFNDNTSNAISDELLEKYTDFITNFEGAHTAYFNRNKLPLTSVSMVEKIKGHGIGATGVYSSEKSTIEIVSKKGISKLGSDLSKSDDAVMHVFSHEYGHYIAETLEHNKRGKQGAVVQSAINKYFDGDIFKSPKDLKDCLSSYGSTSYQEAFAEAFAEAYTCKEPRKFARLFKEELERVISNESIVKSTKTDIIVSGARITNTFSKEADKFADMYYKEIRSFKTDANKIAKNIGKSETDIQKIKAYLFEDKSLYDEDAGEWRQFDPDCAIAQSWQRLMIGKDIKPHDQTMIEHELLEMKIKKENPGIDHYKAHEMATMKYDYRKEAAEYYGNLEKHKEDGK